MLARALDDWWDDLGRPDPYIVYDAGTGPGTLTRALSVAPGRSAAARTVRSFDRAESGLDGGDGGGSGVLPDDLSGAVVIANELLDNVPFRVVERTDDGWAELHVRQPDGDPGAGERLVEQLVSIHDPSALVDLLPAELLPLELVPPDVGSATTVAVGTRVPIVEQAAEWVRAVLDRRAAHVATFDYGAMTTLELVERGGWLRTYRSHQRGDDPLLEPGLWDITVDVPVDQLPVPDEVLAQAAFLRRWGIDELVEEGRHYWAANAGAPDLAAMKMRSRIGEAEALLDPDGLGGWLVCVWSAR